MGSPGGGRNHVDPRFISLFCVFNLIFPADATVLRIFTAILSGHTAQFEPAIRDCVPVLVQMTLDLYKVRFRVEKVRIINYPDYTDLKSGYPSIRIDGSESNLALSGSRYGYSRNTGLRFQREL